MRDVLVSDVSSVLVPDLTQFKLKAFSKMFLNLTITLKSAQNSDGPNINPVGAVVVAQLADRSLPTPDIRGSNPDIGNKLS